MVFFMYPPDLGGGTGKNTPPAVSASPFRASQGQSHVFTGTTTSPMYGN